MAEFQLNDCLAQDTIFIKDLEISKLLLSKDANYPWFILVPKIANAVEIFDLEIEEQQIILNEISQISAQVKQYFKADKINIATLGNVVSQLHIHIVARFTDDKAWPDPIWGKHPAKEYEQAVKECIIATFK